MSEEDRVHELTSQLEIPLNTNMFIQSHTPFAELVLGHDDTKSLQDKYVLVVGGERDLCRQVALK